MADAWSTERRIASWQNTLRSMVVDCEFFLPSDRVETRTYHGWLGEVHWVDPSGVSVADFIISIVGASRTCVTITKRLARISPRESDAWVEWVFSYLANVFDMEYSRVADASAAIFKNGRKLHGSNESSN